MCPNPTQTHGAAGVGPGGPPPKPRTAGEMLAMARAFLARRGVPDARLEGELLVSHAMGVDRLRLFLELDRPVLDAELDRARDLLVRRGRREPVAYIIGAREFYSRRFEVGPGVLIPRPETELVVDLARERAAELSNEPRIVDIGTGSGWLAITLALEIEGARVSAVDVSPEALAYARRNAEALGADVTFFEGEGGRVHDAEVAAAGRGYDLIVSNPPYVLRSEHESLEPEVREHEPELALFVPDDDPDRFANGIAKRAPRWLVPGGIALIELGHLQAARVLAHAQSLGLEARLHRDLDRIERVLELRVPA